MQPKDPNSDLPAHLLAELLELRPDIERILADEPRSSRRFCPILEDKVQTVLLRVLNHLPNYQPHEDGLKPWITRITLNLKLDAHRNNQRRVETFGHDHVEAELAPAGGISPERAAQTRSLLRKVSAAIAEMPSSLQEVLILSAFVGMSHAEIAGKLGITPEASKMRLSRAREYIRERVGALDDHLGVMPVIWSMARRAMRFLGQVVHLWPPMIMGLAALPQFELPAVEPEKTTMVLNLDESQRSPALDMTPSNQSEPKGPVPSPTPTSSAVARSPRKAPKFKPKLKFDVELPASTYLVNDRR